MTYTEEQLNIIKTKIISIGINCSYNLYKKKLFRNNYLSHNLYNKSELNKIDTGITHFFDWLLCDYPNNIRILEMDNIEIEKTFHYDNWEIHKGRKTATLNKNINFDNPYLIRSVHDLNPEINLQNDVIDKYIRRHTRLIHTIKTTPDLMFIYNTYLPDESINNIIETIKKLTTHNFIIVIFDSFENDFETQFKKNNNIYKINFNSLTKTKLPHCSSRVYNHVNNINIDLLFNIIIDKIYIGIK